MKFSKYSAKEDAVPSTISKSIFLLLMLLVMVIIIGGVKDIGAFVVPPSKKWVDKVRKLKEEGKDVVIIKSKDIKPEKSPVEFLEQLKKVKEQTGKNFTFTIFVQDVAKGLVIEKRYDYSMIHYIAKESLNPNYYWEKRETGGYSMFFNCKKFCITPVIMRKFLGKEDWRGKSTLDKSYNYVYYSINLRFRSNLASNVGKKCINAITFFPEIMQSEVIIERIK